MKLLRLISLFFILLIGLTACNASPEFPTDEISELITNHIELAGNSSVDWEIESHSRATAMTGTTNRVHPMQNENSIGWCVVLDETVTARIYQRTDASLGEGMTNVDPYTLIEDGGQASDITSDRFIVFSLGGTNGSFDIYSDDLNGLSWEELGCE